MERKLERCIRLRLVSLCTCVCTRVCVFMSRCERSVCFGGNENKPTKHRSTLKNSKRCFRFQYFSGSFRSVESSFHSSLWTTTTKRKRQNAAAAASVTAMVAAFTVRGAFAAFVLCFCFRTVCVLLASW